MSKQQMQFVKGGSQLFGGTIIGSTFSNGVCKVDLRICNASGYCADWCNIATATEATTAAACDALVIQSI